MKKITLLLLVVTMASSSVTACSIDSTLDEAGYDSISGAAVDIIDQALTLAEDLSVDDIKQQYVDSGLKDVVDDMLVAVENSYTTYDYLVDTSSMEELYHGEEDGEILSVYMDTEGKVYMLNHVTEETTVFTGDAAINFLYSYIEKASGINLNNY